MHIHVKKVLRNLVHHLHGKVVKFHKYSCVSLSPLTFKKETRFLVYMFKKSSYCQNL